MNIEQLTEENELLKQKIQTLENRLQIVKLWMEKEIKSQTHKIAKNKTSKMTAAIKEDFINENFEEVISSRIHGYFWDLLLLNAPKWTVEWITSAEINFYNMKKNANIDGFSVISAYHKVLDLFIESFITNNFRKFAKKKWQIILRVNDPLEKSLHLIVNSKYIMSVGRLYGLLRMILENQPLYDYGKCFREYLSKYSELENILLDKNFYDKFTKINKSEVLSAKRHYGTISKKDTIDARTILIWDFHDKSSLIYKLLESQTSLY